MTRSPEEEEELEQLIRAQELDAKNYKCRGGSPSLDSFYGEGNAARLVDYIDNEGTISLGRWSPRYSCPYHGSDGYVVRPSGRTECGACDRERLARRRRAMGKRRRVSGPGCAHGVENYKEVSGRIRCRVCTRAADRKHYWRKKWKSEQSQATKGSATPAKSISQESRSRKSCSNTLTTSRTTQREALWPSLWPKTEFGDDKPDVAG